MKVRTLLLAAIVLLGGAAIAHAASGSVGIHAGLSAPSGDLARAVGDGFHVGFSVAYPLDSRSGIGFDAHYHVLAEKTSVVRVLGFPISLREKANILEAALSVRAVLAPKGTRVAPYLKGGFGVDHVAADAILTSQTSSIRTTESHLWPGLLGGVGVSMRLGDATGLSLEGLFHQIVSDNGPTDLYTVALSYWSRINR